MSSKDLLAFPILSILFLSLSGCGPGSWLDGWDDYRNGGSNQEYRISPNWQPEQVNITCPSGDCPPGVGAVMFVEKEDYYWRASRCTATLVAPDKIMTNHHCNLNGYHEAYFWLPVQGRTVFRALKDRVFDVFSAESGVGRDLSIWTLRQPLPGELVRQVSRAVPSDQDMKHLVAYVINGRHDLHDAADFELDRRDCNTLSRVPLVNGGVQDRATGVTLFDCEIQSGNSGSPVFAAADFLNVQAVLNTVWNSDSEKTLATPAAKYVFDPPSYLGRKFAMAERVQCLPIEGFSAPDSLCAAAPSLTERLAGRVRALLRTFYDGEPATGRVNWGARAAYFEPVDEAYPVAALAPYAVCLSKEADHVPVAAGDFHPEITYWRLGLNSNNEVETRPMGGDSLIERYHPLLDGSGAVEISLGHSLLSVDSPDIKIWAERSAALRLCQPDTLANDLDDALTNFQIEDGMAEF
jgi:hypothetical protein